ncbi:MAG: carboxylating nicotinate-nucleotide diphosphorylase [bacterium]|nr:carboxylating nicotinate-nucleotide diphosphorylase [bacterium]
MSEIRKVIKAALAEDIGGHDATADALFTELRVVSAYIKAKEDFVLAGLEVAREVFAELNESIIFRSLKKDGDRLKKGDIIAELTGDAADLMKGERTALNFMQRLSGIATYTAEFKEKVRGSRAKIVDTRKTTPGLRLLEKYAVKVGGGHNHRMGLYDGVMIKDNHIAACGGIRAALQKARENAPHTLKIEVEVTDLAGVREAVDSGADIIMLDNMSIEDMREATREIAGRAIVEASGNVNLDTVADIAFTGVDIISVGAITHSARAVDISMKVDLTK